MTNSISKIANSFPIKTLASISTSNSPPTYATIHLAQTQLNSNAMSVPSYGGDGVLGHLALTITPEQYVLFSKNNVPFVAPANPGPAPVHQNNATDPQITETNRQHKEDRSIFRVYHDVDRALRNQLIDAVHPVYIRTLHDKHLGFGNITCLELLTHLWNNYGTITQDELNENELRMIQAWNPPTPIETLFTRLEDGTIFAAAGGEVIAPSTVVRMGYNVIKANGLFDTACNVWLTKVTDADKTMDNFQKHFRAADTNRSRNMTSGNSGYHGVNKSSSKLFLGPPVPAITTASTPYCWTHGCCRNMHTSMTCRNRNDGHNKYATINKKKGGSTWVWIDWGSKK